MIPTAFDEENGVLGEPPGVSLEACGPLSVWRGPTTDGIPVVVSCWKPTKEELDEINRTGRVWLMVWGQTMAPAVLLGLNPLQPTASDPHKE